MYAMGLELAENNEGGSYGDMDDANLTDSQVFYRVKNALTFALQGDFEQFNELIGVMNHTERLSTEEVAKLVTCLRTLSEAVSCIDIVHHKPLLDAIFAMCLWNYDSLVMNALISLITALAASKAAYVDLCLDFLVCNFMPPNYLLKESRYLRNKDEVLELVHFTFKKIAYFHPLSPWRLEEIVRHRMPTKFDKGPPLLLAIYVENMLILENTMGELIGSSMISAVMDRLIELDVEISWDEILQGDFNKGIFEMELEDLEGPEDNPEECGVELCRENWLDKFFGGNATAEQLDSLLVVTFEHLKKLSSSDVDRLHPVFEIFLQSFERTVLTAYKAKFAQFVIFYACSLDPDVCGKQFAVTLFDKFLSSSVPQWRMSAIAYLASYISRAKFFPDRWVVGILERLINWCADYCQNEDRNSNPRAHRVFYAGCQAFMYVLCFRIKSIIAIPGVESQLDLTRIRYILKHPLDPLKVCLPTIVEEFLRVTKSFHLVPENAVQSGLLESEYSVGFGGFERLDMFFPFDPCLLKKSDRFIRPSYYYWSMARSNGDRDDDDDDDDDDDNEVYINDENAIAIGGNRMTFDDDDAQRPDDDDLDYSLNKMSITPKTTLGYHFGGETRMPSRIRPSTSPESL